MQDIILKQHATKELVTSCNAIDQHAANHIFAHYEISKQ